MTKKAICEVYSVWKTWLGLGLGLGLGVGFEASSQPIERRAPLHPRSERRGLHARYWYHIVSMR